MELGGGVIRGVVRGRGYLGCGEVGVAYCKNWSQCSERSHPQACCLGAWHTLEWA